MLNTPESSQSDMLRGAMLLVILILLGIIAVKVLIALLNIAATALVLYIIAQVLART